MVDGKTVIAISDYFCKIKDLSVMKNESISDSFLL